MDTPLEDIEWMLHLEKTEAAARGGQSPARQAPEPPPVPTIK